MGKNGNKDAMAKARKRVARAQIRYTKAVARGEREIRNVRALVDERIARAKAEFDLRAAGLAEVETSAADTHSASLTKSGDAVELPALEVVGRQSKTDENGSQESSGAANGSKSRSAGSTSRGRKK